MPRGARIELTGVLQGGDIYPVLCMADGGMWRLDLKGDHRHLHGQAVHVVGHRSEFDMIDVDRIGPSCR